MQGLRDWFPLFMPLLVGGMERALQLAEAMTARGFSSESSTEEMRGRARLGPLVGLLCLAVGCVRRARPDRSSKTCQVYGMVLIALGALVFVLTLRHMGRQNPHTTYRRTLWTYRDWAVAGGAVAALGILLLLGKSTRAYMPYPALTWPDFDPLVGIGLLGFLLPLLFDMGQGRR